MGLQIASASDRGFTDLDKHFPCKIVKISNFSICFGCSKERYSFGYPQHMFWLRNEIIFLLHTLNESPGVSMHVLSSAICFCCRNPKLGLEL